MNTKLKQSLNPYVIVMLFSFINLIKLGILHLFMGIQEHYALITLLNGLSITALFLLVNFAKAERRRKLFLGVHCLLALLFFANAMYFSHFSTLLPVRIFYQARHLTGVSNSVGALLEIKYGVFIIDLVFIWLLLKRKTHMKAASTQISSRNRWISAGIIFVLVVFTWQANISFHQREEGYYTPFNLGMVNYHFYDLLSLVARVEAQPIEEEVLSEIIEEALPTDQKFHTGIAAGRNVIVIQAESLQSFVINQQVNGQWITPVLNGLIKDNSFYFSRYYEQVGWGNTSDAEFVSQTGLHASTKNYSYKEYEGKELKTLPMLLKEQGYYTTVIHGNEENFWNRNEMYPQLGIDNYISKEDLSAEEIIGMGISDRSLFQQGLGHFSTFQQPFYSLMITLTSHYPYTIEEKDQGLEVGAFYEDTVLGGYFQTVHYLDQALGELIEGLKEAGLYDNSIIVLYGDHHGIKTHDEESTVQMEAFLGEEYVEDEMLRVPLMIHIPHSNVGAAEISRVGGQVDFFPTMANLLGLDLGEHRLVGKDMLNTEDNFALTKIHTARGSFIEGDTMFLMSADGIFENSQAWNVVTGETVGIESCREGYERALIEIQLSEYLLEEE